ncbi:MAG: ceramide glucosyltransferase [Candidatus Poribacteria bacterium]|nr:ceramide glucosyltransferase [Candidatus Poribacteria bacterium]
MIYLIIAPLIGISALFLITLFALVRKIRFKRDLEKKSLDFTPFLNVFVPCKGWNKDLNACLRSILNQNYSNYKVIFITESEEDKASIEILKLLKEYSNAFYLISGRAETCSQKNHNLLKAIEKYSDCDIFVFCDSDLLLENYWLSNLVKPLSDKSISFSASFYSVEIQDVGNKFTSMFYSGFSFYTLMMLLGIDVIWGGSMAIRKNSFEKLKIAELWQKTVVDDMTIAKVVKKENEKVFIVYPNGIKSFISDATSTKNIFKWCKRQILYLKYYLKLYWLLLILIYIPIDLAILSLPVLLIFSFLNYSLVPVLLSYSAVFILMIINHILVIMLNEGKITFRQVIYMLPVLISVSFVLMMTIFTTKLHWSGYIYKMKYNGEVKSIELA